MVGAIITVMETGSVSGKSVVGAKCSPMGSWSAYS